MSSVIEPVATLPSSLTVRATIVRTSKPESQPSAARCDSGLWNCSIGRRNDDFQGTDRDEREIGFILSDS